MWSTWFPVSWESLDAFERAGTHRRVVLAEVMKHRESCRVEQYAALDAIAADFGARIDVDEELRALRATRLPASEANSRVAALVRARRGRGPRMHWSPVGKDWKERMVCPIGTMSTWSLSP